MSKSNVVERYTDVVSPDQSIGEDKISRFLANDMEVVLPGVGDIEERSIEARLPKNIMERLRRFR